MSSGWNIYSMSINMRFGIILILIILFPVLFYLFLQGKHGEDYWNRMNSVNKIGYSLLLLFFISRSKVKDCNILLKKWAANFLISFSILMLHTFLPHEYSRIEFMKPILITFYVAWSLIVLFLSCYYVHCYLKGDY